MQPELDTAAIVAALIFLTVLVSSGVLWIRHANRKKEHSALSSTVPAWPIGWVNFGILICTIIISVFVVQVLSASLIYDNNDTAPFEDVSEDPAIDGMDNETSSPKNDPAIEPAELTPWIAVWAVLALQAPMLAAFYGLRKLYPNHYAGALNQKSLTIGKAMALTFPSFIRYLPIIWASSLIWVGLLQILKEFHLIDEFSPQDLIGLFSEGGNIWAILLLATFAVTLAPIAEEIIFRGAIYRFLKSQTTPLLARIISGLLFALMHGNLMSLLPLCVIGVLLAHVYEQHGNILVPICFHAYFNGFTVLILFITSQSEITFG